MTEKSTTEELTRRRVARLKRVIDRPGPDQSEVKRRNLDKITDDFKRY